MCVMRSADGSYCEGYSVWHGMCVKHISEFSFHVGSKFMELTPYAGILNENDGTFLIWRGQAIKFDTKTNTIMDAAARHYMLLCNGSLQEARRGVYLVFAELGVAPSNINRLEFMMCCQRLADSSKS